MKPIIDIQVNVGIPMRDGVRLGADIYLPSGGVACPVLVSRTPYNKNGLRDRAMFFAQHGYAVVAMDSRGLHASEGSWRPYTDEAEDGYDSQQWIGRQPWCDGQIGMFGRSYPGFAQLLPARFRSEYVRAIMPESCQNSNFSSIWSSNGIYHLALGLSWGPRQEAIAKKEPLPTPNWIRVMHHLPLKSAMEVIGRHSPFVAETLKHDRYDEFWRGMSIREHYAEMDVPAFHVTGWYDDLLPDMIDNFVNMRERSRSAHARRWQKLLIGPWGHGVRGDTRYGEIEFGPGSMIDLEPLHLRWYDYHLRGKQNGLADEAPIRIFVMGENAWRDEREWPPARLRRVRYYLHSDGWANSRMGTGRLDEMEPGSEPADQYSYDPRYPVPTFGGHGNGGGGILPPDNAFSMEGPLDQRSIQQRSDVLVYSSDFLPEDVEATGPIKLRLYFATDAPDTDFFATLSDVYPDGRAILITEGAVRTRYWDSLENPAPLIPNENYRLCIALWDTSNVFKKGHRIRLHLTSSNFPRFNRNLNSGKPLAEETEADLRVARQTIYHDAVRPSFLELPIVPRTP